jgi:nicotinamide-nucleotide amidase
MLQSEIIAVGSELLSFGRTETNSLFLASQLIPLGFRVPRKFAVADAETEIVEVLALALRRSDVVLVTGGLGPTNDDITREVAAGFLGLSLKEDAELLRQLRERYERFGLKMTENNRKQAAVPRTAEVLPNGLGSAPGLLLTLGGKLLFLLPGPPRELHPMVRGQVVPLLKSRLRTEETVLRRLKVGGEAESRVDQRIGDIYKTYSEVETTILSSPGIISLYFVWRGGPDRTQADAVLDELVGRIRDKLGKAVFSDREETLPEALGDLLRRSGKTLATAESCTGGLIGGMLTEAPGSSDYYLGGVVVYSDRAKVELLGVVRRSIEEAGAVSAEVAEQLAVGARDRFGASIGLSVTGIAGPGGGTATKPVGTVFVGLASERETRTRRLLMPGDREAVRLRASRVALDWVRRELS